MGFFVSQRPRGFTLVEVLFVAAIVAILSSVVVMNISESRERSRDVQRKSDIENLQLALRLYKDAEGAYPGATSTSPYDDGVLVGDGGAFDTALADYLTGTIRDPLGRDEYQYYYDSEYDCGGSKKVLIALTMERENAGNHGSVCGSSSGKNLGNGVVPTGDSYVVILR